MSLTWQVPSTQEAVPGSKLKLTSRVLIVMFRSALLGGFYLLSELDSKTQSPQFIAATVACQKNSCLSHVCGRYSALLRASISLQLTSMAVLHAGPKLTLNNDLPNKWLVLISINLCLLILGINTT